MFTTSRGVLNIVAVLAIYTAAGLTVALPHANASPQVRVPCGELDQITESLNDDITAGIDGVRKTIRSPYLSGRWQAQDASKNMDMVMHGIRYMQDINIDRPIPGFAPLLEKLSNAAGDMQDAVAALYQGGFNVGFGGSFGGSSVPLAWPNQGTWDNIDQAEQRKNDMVGFVNNLRGTCTP